MNNGKRKSVLVTGELPTGTIQVVRKDGEIIELTPEEEGLARVRFRDAAHSSLENELRRKIELMLSKGLITKEEHDRIIEANRQKRS